MKFLLFITALSLVFVPTFSSAQLNTNLSQTLSQELGIEVVPSHPEPNETVLLSLSIYTANLDAADIAWYRDGKIVLSGKGEKKYSFTVGAVGQETEIEIKIKLLDGTSFSKTVIINPINIDIVWEANSYVPPFYKGKALHPRQGGLKVVAMPEFIKDGKRISPQNLIYKWSNGINYYQDQNGYGKNTIVINGSLLGKEERISVVVTDPINNITASDFINIQPSEPEIVFYENSPYYGHIFNSAINDFFELKTDEVQIVTAPYYFTKETSSLLNYEWRLNGQTIPDLSHSRTAIFRKPEDKTGQSAISLQLSNTNRILQRADKNLIMNFSN